VTHSTGGPHGRTPWGPPAAHRPPPESSKNALVDERNREAGNSCGPTARTRSVAARGAPLRYVAELIGGDADSEWGHQVADRAHGDTFTMSWTEREGPPVSPPERRGFGTIVMEAMAERSVDGKVDLDYAPSGLTWRLTCPAAKRWGLGNVNRLPVKAKMERFRSSLLHCPSPILLFDDHEQIRHVVRRL
jgi:hypothetical protein